MVAGPAILPGHLREPVHSTGAPWGWRPRRPALANKRVQRNAAGQVVIKLNTAWRGGATNIVMSPLEFMQRLATLVPELRLHPCMTASKRSTPTVLCPHRAGCRSRWAAEAQVGEYGRAAWHSGTEDREDLPPRYDCKWVLVGIGGNCAFRFEALGGHGHELRRSRKLTQTRRRLLSDSHGANSVGSSHTALAQLASVERRSSTTSSSAIAPTTAQDTPAGCSIG